MTRPISSQLCNMYSGLRTMIICCWVSLKTTGWASAMSWSIHQQDIKAYHLHTIHTCLQGWQLVQYMDYVATGSLCFLRGCGNNVLYTTQQSSMYIRRYVLMWMGQQTWDPYRLSSTSHLIDDLESNSLTSHPQLHQYWATSGQKLPLNMNTCSLPGTMGWWAHLQQLWLYPQVHSIAKYGSMLST